MKAFGSRPAIGAPIQVSAISESDRLEARLAFDAQPIVQSLRGRLPTSAELRQISEARGPELAAMVFMKAANASPLHSGFARAILRAQPSPEPKPGPRLEAVVVPDATPGAGVPWGSFVGTVRACARRAGYQTDYVETAPRASVSANARAIADFVESRPEGSRLVLVSFGVGSAEVRFYLQKRSPRHTEKHLGKIRGWLNVAGAFGGAALLDRRVDGSWARFWTKASCALVGRSYGSIAEASSRFGVWQEPFAPPPRALIASLVPVPLPWHLPTGLRRPFRALARRGPSDGAVLLADSAAKPGLVYPAWGLSHASEASEWASLVERALAVMAEALSDRPVEAIAPDLSVEYAETDPNLRRARKLADRIGEQKRAAARASARAVRARAEREALRERSVPSPAAASSSRGAGALDDIWQGALVEQTGRAKFDAAEWEMAQFFGARLPAEPAPAPVPPSGSASTNADPSSTRLPEDDDTEDRFRFL